MATAMCEVLNYNDVEYTEKFKNKEIVIPAKGTIKMRLDEAVVFLGTQNPGSVLNDNTGEWMNPKRLKIINVGKLSIEESKEVCPRCGAKFNNVDSLKSHIEDNHIGQQFDKDDQAQQVALATAKTAYKTGEEILEGEKKK